MRVPDIKIAVDGYSSTGKSSFAKLLAKKFDFLYLDSGAMYRGVTYFAQQNGYISPDNVISDSLKDALKELDLHFEVGSQLYMGAECIESQIRSMTVSSQVSPIATVPYVRAWVGTTSWMDSGMPYWIKCGSGKSLCGPSPSGA